MYNVHYDSYIDMKNNEAHTVTYAWFPPFRCRSSVP